MPAAELMKLDKEKLIARIRNAGTPKEAVPVLEAEIDRILAAAVAAEENPRLSEMLSFILRTVRMTVRSADCVKEVRAFEEKTGGRGKQGRSSAIPLILLAVGIALIAALFLIAAAAGGFVVSIKLLPVYILLAAGLCVLLAGTVDDAIVKPTVARWRPTHDPEIGMMVDIVNGYRGGNYGFFSAHASNTFSIAIFFCWLIRSRLLSVALVIWSLTNCWTRLYLGVHYPGDILVGLAWGAIVGTSVYLLYRKIYYKLTPKLNYVSSQYTSTGYSHSDIDVLVTVVVFVCCYIVIRAAITAI